MIKVMVVDDSAVVRKALGQVISSDPGMKLLAAAADPLFAMTHMAKEWPDVIILDVEMPRMDGITFMRKIMQEHPTPIIMCSTLTESGSETAMEAMACGAVDIITKPKIGVQVYLQESAKLLLETIRSAARANVSHLQRRTPLKANVVAPKLNADVILAPPGEALKQTTDCIVALGTSTGGTNALEAVLTSLPRVCPGIVIVQHMPEAFTAAFAKRLNSISDIEVKEAEANDAVLPGRALIAHGGRHMVVKRSGARYYVDIVEGPLVSRHRPSVDVLFRSVAKAAGKNALGIIMTGMGDDGAAGLLEMRQVGSATLGQNEASCVVYGMPKEANKRGAVEREVGLADIPAEIMKYFSASPRAGGAK